MKLSKAKIGALVLGLAVAGGLFYLWQSGHLFPHDSKGKSEERSAKKYPAPVLIAENGSFGLKLSKAAIESLDLNPKTVETAREPIPLPPIVGTINYDNERLFSIKPRFTGEIAEVKEFEEIREATVDGSSSFKPCKRPLKFGDKVKQGDTLAVFWSQTLGVQKAAFVDAISNLKLSQEALDRQEQLFREGALSISALKAAQRQVQIDNNAVLTAERTLRIWKLTDQEIQQIRDEAKIIQDQKAPRDVVAEVKRWARVEIKVPTFDPENPNRELTVVEKNTHLNDFIDPTNFATPLFKVADLSRLQIWGNPPEELLPTLRERLKAGRGGLKWRIRFQSEPPNSPGMELDVAQISHGLDPNVHTALLIGYLQNPKGDYLVGQFVTATILVPPPAASVAVPTDAINPLENKNFVFVVKPGTEDEFLIRRVSVAQSFKAVTYVRTKLTPEDERINQEVGHDGFKVEPLQPGERIVTRGVLELTEALDDLRSIQPTPK